MDLQRRLQGYSIARLDGLPIPADLKALLSAMWSDAGFAGSDRDPGAILWFHLLGPGETHPLLSHDNLTDADRANPDIMANVEAMIATSALCCFVAVTDDGDLVGYWRGPDGLEPEKAPIVRLDTEGQYSLLPEGTILRALCLLITRESSAAAERLSPARDAFARLGVSMTEADLALPQASERLGTIDPNDYRDKLYMERRAPQS